MLDGLKAPQPILQQSSELQPSTQESHEATADEPQSQIEMSKRDIPKLNRLKMTPMDLILK